MASSTDPAENYMRMWFKGNKVWAEKDETGNPGIVDGRVKIKYRLDQPHEYAVNPGNLRSLKSGPGPEGKKKIAPKKPNKSKGTYGGNLAEKDREDAICVYTDGASSGNPGPSGIGVFLCYGSHEKTISRYIGNATNNIAELQAILEGLSLVKRTGLPVRVFTDSQYAYGLLCQNWTPRKNKELVDRIKQAMSRFSDLKLIKVPGHAGLDGNERADRLAVEAVKKRKP